METDGWEGDSVVSVPAALTSWCLTRISMTV